MIAVGCQIDSDKRLLDFQTYEDYLDSIVTLADLCYIKNIGITREIAAHGYRHNGETVSKESFQKRRKKVEDLLYPIRKSYDLISELYPIENQNKLQFELTLRERGNREGTISTIIFLRHVTKLPLEISGYIDFAEKLDSNEDEWHNFYGNRGKLIPKVTDLSYYHWKLGKCLLNETSNYKPVIDPKRGLMFENLHDRKFVCVDPKSSSPGIDTTRIRIFSDQYDSVILYDHLVRFRC